MPSERTPQLQPDFRRNTRECVLEYWNNGNRRRQSVMSGWERCEDMLAYYHGLQANGQFRGYRFTDAWWRDTGQHDEPAFTLPTSQERIELVEAIKQLEA